MRACATLYCNHGWKHDYDDTFTHIEIRIYCMLLLNFNNYSKHTFNILSKHTIKKKNTLRIFQF
jgi:hypothetical protein